MRVRAGVTRLAIGVVFAVILYLLPLAVAASPYVLFALTLTLCYAIPAMALNLLLGYTGLVSLGHMGFAGIGAYVTAVLMKNGIAPFAPAIVSRHHRCRACRRRDRRPLPSPSQPLLYHRHACRRPDAVPAVQ